MPYYNRDIRDNKPISMPAHTGVCILKGEKQMKEKT
jgi:hypothetical protein